MGITEGNCPRRVERGGQGDPGVLMRTLAPSPMCLSSLWEYKDGDLKQR